MEMMNVSRVCPVYAHHDGGGSGVHVDQLLQLLLIGIPVVVDASHLEYHE